MVICLPQTSERRLLLISEVYEKMNNIPDAKMESSNKIKPTGTVTLSFVLKTRIF